MPYNFTTVGIETGDGYTLNVNTTDDNQFVLDINVPQDIIESDGGYKFHRLSMDMGPACEFLKGVGIAIERMIAHEQDRVHQAQNPTPEILPQYFNAPFPEEPDISAETNPALAGAIFDPETDYPMPREQVAEGFPEEPDETLVAAQMPAQYQVFEVTPVNTPAEQLVAWKHFMKRENKMGAIRQSLELLLPWEDSAA